MENEIVSRDERSIPKRENDGVIICALMYTWPSGILCLFFIRRGMCLSGSGAEILRAWKYTSAVQHYVSVIWQSFAGAYESLGKLWRKSFFRIMLCPIRSHRRKRHLGPWRHWPPFPLDLSASAEVFITGCSSFFCNAELKFKNNSRKNQPHACSRSRKTMYLLHCCERSIPVSTTGGAEGSAIELTYFCLGGACYRSIRV